MPSAKDDGATLVRQYRDATRKEDGNLRAEAIRRIGQSNQFVIIDAWKDRNAFDAHGKAASTTQFRDKLKAIQNAPYDERVHNALSAGPLAGGRFGGGAVYAVTHIDVIPPRKDDGTALVKQHARRQPQGRRQPALRDPGAGQPAEPFHRGRDLAQTRRRRRPRHERAYASLPRQARADERRAL